MWFLALDRWFRFQGQNRLDASCNLYPASEAAYCHCESARRVGDGPADSKHSGMTRRDKTRMQVFFFPVAVAGAELLFLCCLLALNAFLGC